MSFWTLAEQDASRLALVEPEGREVSAGELFEESNRLAHGLRGQGLKRDSVVAALLPNGAEFVELYLACLQSGWRLTPINYHLTAEEIGYIIKDCEAEAFVCSERYGEAGRQAADGIGFPEQARFAVGTIEGFRPYAELKEGQPGTRPEERAPGGVMNYTAGTTGKPKGVRRDTVDLDVDIVADMHAAFLMLFSIEPNKDNVHLVVSPLYHTAVLTFASDSLHMGHPVVLMDKWTPEGTLERIERYKVTTSHMVPTQFHRLLALPEEARSKAAVSSLRHIVHSAAPCPVDVKRRMLEWWGPVIYEYYAATEGGGTLATPEEWKQKPGTVGKPWPISEIRILDDDGKPVSPNEPGTVWIKMADYTFEYYKDKAKTEESWSEGFFTVGDVGYLDEDGFLFLADRKADMIISGGVNIYPAEIEAVLLTHSDIADAAVFGIPNEDWGEEVKAAIELRDKGRAGPEMEEKLLAFTAEHAAKYKVPRSIDFVDEMPRDPNGKLYKRVLRDPYWKGRERAI
ncbi:MAG: acyl-CoA synthetase [Actinomycetota bacterium]